MPRATTERVCEVCGTAFVALLKEITRGNGRLCSRSCRGRLRQQKRNADVAAAFWAQVDRSSDTTRCWEWRGCDASPGGYGRFHLHGRRISSHRMAYTISNGEIPEGKFVCHRCDNPPCCNPAHLFLGSPGENVRDMWGKGRASNNAPSPSRGEQAPQAKLSDAQVQEILIRPESAYDLATIYGVTHHYIRALRRRSARRTRDTG